MFVEEEVHRNGNVWFVTFIKYYPTRFTVAQNYIVNRQDVFNFKDGISNPAVINVFTSYINRLKELNPNFDFWLSVIPASTIAKTRLRFSNFCQTVSTNTGIHNGYSLLTSCNDRNQVHVGGVRNYSKILECITFGDVRGKNILLCDDVATTGRSFNIIAQHLTSLGASNVNGLMLAKTHWLE